MKKALLALVVSCVLLASCAVPTTTPTQEEEDTVTIWITGIPLPTGSPFDVSIPSWLEGYWDKDAKVISVSETRDGLPTGVQSCGIYVEGKVLPFAFNVYNGNAEGVGTWVAAAEKSGVLFRFGPCSSGMSENHCGCSSKTVWGLYIEEGKEEELMAVKEELNKHPYDYLKYPLK